MKRWKRLLAAEIITLIYVVLILKFLGIFFETNDDRYITEILSGVISAEPDGHVPHMNYLLASLFAFMYRIAGAIPWYGGCLILFHWQSYALLLDCFLEQFETIRGRAAVIFASLLLFAAHIYLLAQIQYTSTAILMAAVGYVCLILKKDKGSKIGAFIMLELLAFLLRSEAMLVVQPFGMAAYIGIILPERESALKDKIKRIAGIMAVLGVVFCIGWCGSLVGYHSEEWREYQRYHRARIQLFDYYGIPQYEDVADILEGYHVTKEQYYGFCNYVVLDKDIPTECLEELADYARQGAHRSVNPADLVKQRISLGIQGGSWSVNRLSTLLILTAAVYLLIKKGYRGLLPLTCMGIADVVVWSYLLIQGRMPRRVVLPLFLAESLLLISLMLWAGRCEKGGTLLRCPTGMVIGAALCAFCVFIIIQECPDVQRLNQNQKVYFEGMYELQNYCNENPSNRYLIEANSQSYYTGSALETRIYQERNSLITGCWYSTSPSMEKRTEEYFSGWSDGFYFIIMDDGDVWSRPAMQYMVARQGSEPELADSLAVSNGLIYSVFYFE